MSKVNVKMTLTYAGASGGSGFDQEEVIFDAGGQGFTEKTNSEGEVIFLGVPCDCAARVRVIDQNIGKMVGRVFPLKCAQFTIDLGEFYIFGDGKLHNNQIPSLEAPLRGGSVQRFV